MLQYESSAELALSSTWEALGKRFRTKQRPAQHLLQTLLRGPTITFDEPDTLYAFARNCQTAVELQRLNRGLLASLEEQTTQDTIALRLEWKLYVKWHEYCKRHFRGDSCVPFERFASWIDLQAEICLDCQDTATNGLEPTQDSKIHQIRQDGSLNPSPFSSPNSPTPIALHISSQGACVPQDTQNLGARSNDSGFVTLTRAPESTHRNDQRQSSHIKSFREQPTEFKGPHLHQCQYLQKGYPRRV